jgi:hypothetical protein
LIRVARQDHPYARPSVFANKCFSLFQFPCPNHGCVHHTDAHARIPPYLENCMRVRTTAAATVLAAVATLPLAGIANAEPTDRDCEDFATQQEAQAALDARLGDPERLDADNDGIACEWLVSVSNTTIKGQVRSVPQGGLDTGDGTTADDARSELLVAGGIILAGGLAVAAIRRRTGRRSS